MPTAIVFVFDRVEEIEAISVIDILRRGNIEVTVASLMGERFVTGSHGVEIGADSLFEDVSEQEFDMLVMPGGPGTPTYKNHSAFLEYLKKEACKAKYIAAICAAPTILGMLGLLEGKRAVCFPGMEDELIGAIRIKESAERVVTDGKVITAAAAGVAPQFALELLRILAGAETEVRIRDSMLIRR